MAVATRSVIRFLDVRHPLSQNPVPLVADGQYTSPQYLPHGNLVAVAPFCSIAGVICPAPQPGSDISSIDTLDASTRQIIHVGPWRTLEPALSLCAGVRRHNYSAADDSEPAG